MHRKIYYKHHNKIPNPKCDIHHIDGNHYNNNINNLIEMPRQLHQALHNYIGLLPRKNIVVLLKWFNRKQKNKFSRAWLELNIKKQVSKFKLSKSVLLSNKALLEKKAKNWEKNKKWITRLRYWDTKNSSWLEKKCMMKII